MFCEPSGARFGATCADAGSRRTADDGGGDRLRLTPDTAAFRCENPVKWLSTGMDLAMAAVVVPAHNELAHLPQCLRALATAAACLPVPELTVVVLPATDD